jgi:hypothetical protein
MEYMAITLFAKQISQEVNPMYFNKNVKNFADYLVFHYAKRDEFGNYYLTQDDIPEFDLDEFCAVISSNNKDYASEACGPDNDNFYTKMLPALNLYMSNSTNKRYENDFSKTWREGIRNYYSNTIDQLLNEALENYSLTSAA